MNHDAAGGLRRYMNRFDFERIADVLGRQDKEYIALYGSLMQNLGKFEELELGVSLSFEGPCKIAGKLFDLGEYPGLLPGDGVVMGELFSIPNLDVLSQIDKFERYEASDRDNSLFIRRCVRLIEPRVDAWLYYYSGDREGARRVVSGNWRQHIRRRETAA